MFREVILALFFSAQQQHQTSHYDDLIDEECFQCLDDEDLYDDDLINMQLIDEHLDEEAD